MKLINLNPAWLSPDVFIFRSPSGRGDWLTCKRVKMSLFEQYELVYAENSPYIGSPVVLCAPECAWEIIGSDFNTLTVTPSIDASSSGNWHGFITNGNIL